MKNLLFLIFIFCFFSLPVQGQEAEYEYVGILKFSMTSMVSYRLVFTESNGEIIGYSVTDMQGENETKNKIKGAYDKNTGNFSFYEQEIEYTKSEVIQSDFCYIHFAGKFRPGRDNKLKGSFKGYFKDGSSCVNGNLHLVSEEKAHKRIVKMNNKVQKSKRLDEETKKEADLVEMMDELKLNLLTDEGVTTVFVTSDTISLEIWDTAKEDGDKVTIYFNDKVLISDCEIKKEPKKMEIPISKQESFIRIKALNNGAIAPNTARVKFHDSVKTLNFVTNLEEGSASVIRIIKK